jgi:type IV pilus assembly protein PilW
MRARHLSPGRRSGGFTLPEMLVSLVIALIALLAIGSVVITNERFQRATIGTSDAQSSGALALYAIERDARMAGYGLTNNKSPAFGGSIQYYYDADGGECGDACYSKPVNAASTLPELRFAPVVIENAAEGPDAITFFYANPGSRIAPEKFIGNGHPLSGKIALERGVSGFMDKELIIVCDPNENAGENKGCSLAQITKTPPPPEGALEPELEIQSAGSPWNPAGGDSKFETFIEGAHIFNLGRPVVQRYDVSDGRLRLARLFAYASAAASPTANSDAEVLYDQIVDLQAEYGSYTGANPNADTWVVDSWSAAAPADWTRVLAVRVGILARSRDESRRENDACTATTAQPVWAGGNLTVPGGLPSCYRFRVFETVIPLRNMIWRES